MYETTSDPYIPPTRIPNQPVITPDPHVPPKPLPTLRTEDVYYSVQWGDTIKSIAYRHDVLPELIIEVNQIPNSGLIYAGQQLLLPAPDVSEIGPGYKIIPDSELVRSPYTIRFQIEAFINNQPGYLKNHEEEN